MSALGLCQFILPSINADADGLTHLQQWAALFAKRRDVLRQLSTLDLDLFLECWTERSEFASFELSPPRMQLLGGIFQEFGSMPVVVNFHFYRSEQDG